RATSSLPTLVKFERTLVQLFGLGNEVDVRPPWLLHVLEHYGLSACRTSLSTQTLEQPPDTSGFSRDCIRSRLSIRVQDAAMALNHRRRSVMRCRDIATSLVAAEAAPTGRAGEFPMPMLSFVGATLDGLGPSVGFPGEARRG
ncbi:hypothetical protein, partial [Xanthomonas translucens]|uniref:hypothetical protein n=1 Tax=Xanthomonas campestris pv. translucens TaxID=343 RepID=UPI001E2CEEE3